MLKLGVGACIVGSPVRYSGDAKRHNPFMDSVASVAELVAFCPEVSIGLGVPREPIRLVDEEGQVRVKDSSTQTKDFTNKLQKAAQSYINDMLTTSPMGLRLTKEGLNVSIDAAGLEAVMAVENRNQVLCSRTRDAKEGMQAFLEKRAPNYTGT